jgi:hypothetical protein
VPSQPVEFLEWVEPDLTYAMDFHDSWLTNGAGRFLSRFREAVTWIEASPGQFPKKHRFFHRAIIRRTYFGIYFVIEPEVTTVVAVLDMRNDPRIIRALLKLRLPKH